MFESRNRPFAPALAAALAGIVLGGCHASSEGPESPPPPPPEVATARFDLATGVLPSATNLLLGPEDYTLNLPAAMAGFRPLVPALNALDGWSTTAGVDTSFTLPIDATSIGASSIKIVKFYMNPSLQVPANPADPAQALAYLPTGATSPVAGPPLTYGTDFTAEVTQESESGGKVLRITPLKPLDFSRGPAVTGGKVLNIGYTVLLTNSLKATGGQAYGPDALYAAIKSAPADCSSFTDATQKKVCLITRTNLGVAAAATSTSADSVILSWTFSTQSIDDSLNVIALTTTPKQTLIVPAYNALLGRILTTRDANAALPGKANIYLGSTQLPYYLTAPTTTSDAAASAAVLSSFWQAAGPPPAPFTNTARPYWLTMFNPTPAATSTVTVPLLVTVPNTASACGGVMPAGGWPVVIVQHGITGDRSQALAMADSMADACTIVVSMDLPLHGLTVAYDPNPANPNPLSKVSCAGPLAAGNAACLGARERTFDVDLVRNSATTVAVPDGNIDASGTHFINLSSPLTGRDNLRQAEAGLIQLTKSLPGMIVAQAAPGSLPAGPVAVNATHISYVGLSLGAIVGGSHLHFINDVAAATLSAPGGVLTQLLLDSESIGPSIRSGLSAKSVFPGSYVFGQFMRDFQAVIDSGDPINHIADATALHPTYLQKVIGDRVVPNSATDRLIAKGGFAKVSSGITPVLPGSPKYVAFPYGTHGSLFSPGGCLTDVAIKDDPAKVLLCQKTTVEMQRQAVIFTSQAAPSGVGSAVVVTDTSVVQP
ncbi:MAG TPA: hypothetical protein VFX81_00170 [Burkholderiaceae bacterium]|nr:hypothetical protein [Burkholderiaceae bacterium]